jgi:hypothetical protein
MNRILAVAVTICSLLFVTNALAEGKRGKKGHRHGPPPIEDIDTNGNKSVSFDEFQAWHAKKLESRFKRMDADQNGEITKEEFEEVKARRKKMRKKRREKFKNRMKERDE